MKVEETAGATGQVDIAVHDPSTIPDGLTREERVEHYRRVDPVREISIPNTTCIELDEHRARSHTFSGSAEPVDGWEVGTDSTAPQYTDREINNRVYTADIVSADANGTDLVVTSFLDTTEANGNDLVEGGLKSLSDLLFNHATYAAISKTSNREVVYEITITFQ